MRSRKLYSSKLYSSRQVKQVALVYVPEIDGPKLEQQKNAVVNFTYPKGFFRVKALIDKYQVAMT